MKEVKAIIKPFRLEDVVHALRQIPNLPAVTISTAQGLSVERGTFDQVVKTKLEIMVPDELVEIQRPLVAVIFGGLITSLALTLIILPVLYVLFNCDKSATGADVV